MLLFLVPTDWWNEDQYYSVMSTCVFSEDFAQVCCVAWEFILLWCFEPARVIFSYQSGEPRVMPLAAHRRATLRLVKKAIIQLNTVKWAELQQTEFPDQNIVIITTSNPLEKYTWKASEHIIILKLHVHINTFNTMNKKNIILVIIASWKGKLVGYVFTWNCWPKPSRVNEPINNTRERESIEVNEIGLKSEFCCGGATADSGATKAHSHWSAAILSVLNDRLKYQR